MDETGIRQTELCEKTGIGRSAMCQYLHGAFMPKQQKLRAIAEALNVSEPWLMGYDDRVTMEILAPDDSMQSMHIPKGAKVILNPSGEELPQGEIVCITINNGKMQLRFLHMDGDKIMLTAADPGYTPHVFDKNALDDGTLQIHGVVERVEIKF